MSPEIETVQPPSNFFLDLAKAMVEIESSTSGVRQVVEIGVASTFLKAILGTDWFDRNAKPQAKYDRWMQNRLRPEGTHWIIYFHHLLRLADAWFTLIHGGVTSGDILRKRFHERPTKPCYIELQVASLLSVNGFHIEIIGESGVRGRDFDLSATQDTISLSIEITGKDDIPLTANTIRNTLRGKRTQIPTNRPAILYMHIPAIWMRDRAQAQRTFTEAFESSFRNSHRFNAVFLIWEDVIPNEHGGLSETTLWPCYNNYPRNPFNKWSLLDLQTDSTGKPRFAISLYDFLKGVQAKHLANG
jgi:hypothetical protein